MLNRRKLTNSSLLFLHALDAIEVYRHFDNLFEHLPNNVKEHRIYFEKEGRGFGERAFHSAWYWLISTFFSNTNSNLKFLEIGVFRGQTLTLIPLIAKELKVSAQCHGISPLDNSADEVSTYPCIDYQQDILHNSRIFEVETNITLLKEYSNSNKALSLISSLPWDLIYIDGSHDYVDVKNDAHNCVEALSIGGILVFDDSSLFLNDIYRHVRKPKFLGHKGPSSVIKELISTNIIHLLTVGHLNFFIKVR
jgi:hypothetical protein